MSAKVEIDLVKAVLQRNDLDASTVSQILEDIRIEQDAMLEEEDKTPPVKKQYVVVLSDPKGELADKNFIGWVVQIPEDAAPFVALERLHKAAYSFNVTPKGRRMPVKTISEVCEFVPPRVTKEEEIWVRTKEPVYVLRTDGKVPMLELVKAAQGKATADE